MIENLQYLHLRWSENVLKICLGKIPPKKEYSGSKKIKVNLWRKVKVRFYRVI